MLMVVCLCRNEGERGPGTEEALLESSRTKVWANQKPFTAVFTLAS